MLSLDIVASLDIQIKIVFIYRMSRIIDQQISSIIIKLIIVSCVEEIINYFIVFIRNNFV